MKKTYILIAICFAFFSCTKTIPDRGDDIDTSGTTCFLADYEEVALIGTSNWVKGDHIGVFSRKNAENERYVIEKPGAGMNTAWFYGPRVDSDVLAYHPFDINTKMENGMVSLWLEPLQEFCADRRAGDQFLEYCKTSIAAPDESGMFHFRYPLGILSVQIDFVPAINVREITVVGSRGLSGKLYGNGIDVIPSEIANRTVTLDFGETSVPSSIDGKCTEFYLLLPPSVYEAGELSLRIDSVEEQITVNLPKTEIVRVNLNDFLVTTIKITPDALEPFTGKEGYLE